MHFYAVLKFCLYLLLTRYWIEQINAFNEISRTKPTIVVGTHIDKLSTISRKLFTMEMESKYNPSPQNSNYQLQGHFALDLSEKAAMGQNELRSKLLETALHHPQIGIANVKVPQNFVSLSKEIASIKNNSRPYIFWREFEDIAKSFGMYEAF